MIESISKLDPNTKKMVLAELHKRGLASNNHYVRFSHQELSHMASFFSSCGMDISEREATSILNQLNNRETRLFKLMLNSPAKAPTVKELTQYTTRTRLAVNRILKGIEDKNKEDATPVKNKLEKLMGIFA